MQSAEQFIEQALSPRPRGEAACGQPEGPGAAAGMPLASQESPSALGEVLAILRDHSEQLRRLWSEHAELAAEHRRLRERVGSSASAAGLPAHPPERGQGAASGARSRSVSPIGSTAPPLGASAAAATGPGAARAPEDAGRPSAAAAQQRRASGKTPPPQRRGSTPPPGKAATTTVWFGSKPGIAQPAGAAPKAEAQRPAAAAPRRSLTPPGARGHAAPAAAARAAAATPGAAAAAAPRSPTPPAAARSPAAASATRRSTTPPAAAAAGRGAARGSTPPPATRIPAAAARKPASGAAPAGGKASGGGAKAAARDEAPAEGDAPPDAASGKAPSEAALTKRRSTWGAKVGAKAGAGAGASPSLFELAGPLLEASTPPEAREEALAGVVRALERGAAAGSWQGPGTPLRAAVQGRATDFVQALLKARADANESDDKGVSLLHVAAFDGAPELCGALLEAGACANAKDRHGQTPLFFAPSGEVCELLHKYGAACDQTNQKGQLALHLAGRAGLSDVLAWLAQPGHMPEPMLEQKDVHGATAAYYAHHAGVPKEFLMRHRLLSLESPESPERRGGSRGAAPGGLQRLPQLPEVEDEDAESPPGTARRLRPSIGGEPGPQAAEEEDARQQQLRHRAAVRIQAAARAALGRWHPRVGAGRPSEVPLLTLPVPGGAAAPPRDPARAAGADVAVARERRTWGSRSRAQRAGADAAAGAAGPAAPRQAWEESPAQSGLAAGLAGGPADHFEQPLASQGADHLAEAATVLQAAWRGRAARARASAETLRQREERLQAQDLTASGGARRLSRESVGSCRLSVSDMVTWEPGDEAEIGEGCVHTPASSEFSENPSSPGLDDSKDRRKQRRSRISESQGYLR